MNFELTEEQKLVQKTARDFSRTELLPGAVDRDVKKNMAKVTHKKNG